MGRYLSGLGLRLHCMNFGIYKTFTFHVNMPNFHHLYLEFTSPLPLKEKDLKVIFLLSLLDVSKTLMSHFVVSLRIDTTG